MLFTKKEWKNRVSEYPNRRLLIKEDGEEEYVTVERAEGNIEQEGDILNAENMNDLENRINIAFTKFPFNFGIDENGNCGFIKPGEDVVTPFGSGGGGTSRTAGAIEQLQMASVTGLTSTIETKVLDYDYIIQTESTGGNDASIGINGTVYMYSNVKSTPVIFDNAMELSYGDLHWTLKALTNLQDSESGISYSQNDTIATWSYSSTIKIMLKKVE